MAWLVPATRKIDEIRPFAEQEVVKTFVEKLSKDWVVIPKVHITFKGQNAEIDVILVSRNRGVFFVEVKGGEISIDNGQWKSRDEKGDVHNIQNPIEQLVSAKHQLVKRLGKMNFSLNDLFIRDLVVLPKNTEVPRDGLGPGLPRESIFTKLDLEDPEAALARIVREHAPIELNRFKAFIQILCPTVRFTDEGGEFHQTVLHRVDAYSRLVPLVRARPISPSGGRVDVPNAVSARSSCVTTFRCRKTSRIDSRTLEPTSSVSIALLVRFSRHRDSSSPRMLGRNGGTPFLRRTSSISGM
jgi:hypothetical protein